MQLSKSATKGQFNSVRENYEAQYRAARILKSEAVPARYSFYLRTKDDPRRTTTVLAERSLESRRDELSGWHSAREVNFLNRSLDLMAEQMGLNNLSLLTPAERGES